MLMLANRLTVTFVYDKGWKRSSLSMASKQTLALKKQKHANVFMTTKKFFIIKQRKTH